MALVPSYQQRLLGRFPSSRAKRHKVARNVHLTALVRRHGPQIPLYAQNIITPSALLLWQYSRRPIMFPRSKTMGTGLHIPSFFLCQQTVDVYDTIAIQLLSSLFSHRWTWPVGHRTLPRASIHGVWSSVRYSRRVRSDCISFHDPCEQGDSQTVKLAQSHAEAPIILRALEDTAPPWRRGCFLSPRIRFHPSTMGRLSLRHVKGAVIYYETLEGHL